MPPTFHSPARLTIMDSPVASNPVVVAVLNQKGGVGKTTSVVNVGAGLALAGRRVLLVDLDPQGHLGLHLGGHLLFKCLFSFGSSCLLTFLPRQYR